MTKKMNLEICHAKPEHCIELSKLVAQYRQEHSRMLGGFNKPSLLEIELEVKTHVLNEKSGYIIAMRDGGCVGYRKWECRDQFYFTTEFYVSPEVRRQGIARSMITYFEAWLLERGQKIACVSITPHNRAMLNLLRAENYDILNTIELRKHLTEDLPQPRNKAEALGYIWKVL
jgi:GNAT superfamily N-acetyltransferase